MFEEIDCLFIGHNEMPFMDYEKNIRSMGINSGAYSELNLSFIKKNKTLYTCMGLYENLKKTKQNNDNISDSNEKISLTIAYLASYLWKRGFSFDFINLFQKEKEQLKEKLVKSNIATIVIPTTYYVSILPILEIVKFVKKYNTTSKIIIGGPFISTQMRTQNQDTVDYLFKLMGADFYINNPQGENALAKLVDAIKNSKDFTQFDNIIYRKDGDYFINRYIPENNILEDNVVDWKLFESRMGKLAATRTSISCPFSCAFCGFPEHAGKYQVGEIEMVEKEFNNIESIGKVKSLNLIDDTFNIPNDRFKEILKMMIRNKYSFRWNSHLRCQFIDEETVQLMKESGCEGVFLGIESGNQEILNNMNKATKLEKYRLGIELLNKYEIISHASFIIGFPGETRNTIQDTVNFIEECKPTFYRAQLWYCDPLTPIWKEKDKYCITGSQFEWKHSTMNSKNASNYIKEIFMNVNNSIWLPQSGFEFDGIYRLLHTGMSLEQVKKYIVTFNKAVAEKIQNIQQEDVNSSTLQELQNYINF